MYQPTLITWILVIFGIVFIYIPIVYAQLMMASKPDGRKTKDLLIGKGEEWRDRTHLRMSIGIAWADIIFWLPFIATGSIGVLLGYKWGYLLWAISGAISVYISIVLWFSEREYVYPALGALAYYTVYWGFFVYWGIAVIAYTLLRIEVVIF
ncbi:MAG: hypothetical protein GY855_05015 [candidate division Zixibacteria bacterium]|nr:hypothetical protein [candidate division Zixibacteria bacterium]